MSLNSSITIQQNLELPNNYQNEINDYKLKKEKELQKIEKSENEIAIKLNEIKSLQFKKEHIQNIQIVQQPHGSPDPIKPTTKLSVIVALAAGFFLMIILSFFFEYFQKATKKKETK